MQKMKLPLIDSCDDCGACCMGQSALPIHLAGDYFTLESVKPLPEWLRAELRDLGDKFDRDGFPADNAPCIWFDAESRRCRHYEYRPEICRDEVVPGDEGCRLWRAEKGIACKPS